MRIVAFLVLALMFFPVLGAALGMALGAILSVLRRDVERSLDVETWKDRLAPAENTLRPQPQRISHDRTQQRNIPLAPAIVLTRRSRSISATSAILPAAGPNMRRNVSSARRHNVAEPAFSALRGAGNLAAQRENDPDIVI